MTLQLGLAPDYVLDKMQLYEARCLINYSYLKNKDNWEQARLIGYITAQCQSSKKLKLTDILKFNWEEKNNQPTTMSDEDLKRLKEKAKAIINNNII